MLPDRDAAYLRSALRRNRVVLFLGAGFSRDATNFADNQLPLSNDIASALWRAAGFEGDYDGTELRFMYDAARKRKGDLVVRTLLRDLLTVRTYPDWYHVLGRLYWYRIYTTNIDNLVEAIYGGTPTVARLQSIIAPDDFHERDMLLRSTQHVKLHGSAADLERPITFAPIEYGRRASLHDTWYDHFLRDYTTHPTILIGTELNEPLFWQYLAARQDRPRGTAESRPKSFLVSPNITRGRLEALGAFNIHAIQGTSKEFFDWLAKQPDTTGPREQILLELDPSLEQLVAMERAGLSRAVLATAETFFETLEDVTRARDATPSTRRDFLLGVPPSWSDLERKLDADREIVGSLATVIRDLYRQKQKDDLVVLHGPAGSGKSTTVMRVSALLAREGIPIHFAHGRTRPDPEPLLEHLRSIDARVTLVFANGGADLRFIAELREKARTLEHPPLFVLTLRSNDWLRQRYMFAEDKDLQTIQMPDLSEFDIENILSVLEREGLLGALGPMTQEQRKDVFREKSKKQILVAMREATRGQGFDEIIRDEFNGLPGLDAKLCYLVVAVPTMHQFDVALDELISALDLQAAETVALVRDSLRGIVFPHPTVPDRFVLRHPVIAEHVVINVAPRDMLADAYIRYLQVLAHEINLDERPPRRSRIFRLAQQLLNHERLHDMFARNPETCRRIYDAVRDHYGDNGHFWLQYGAYELGYGHLDLAENYLLRAQGYIPHNEQLVTTFGHLYFRKSIEATSPVAAQEFQTQGEDILRQQIKRIGLRDPYPYHVLGSQMLAFIRHWVPAEKRIGAFQNLHKEISPGMDRHPLAGDLRQLVQDIKRAELSSVANG